jgi:hypothetical protein
MDHPNFLNTFSKTKNIMQYNLTYQQLFNLSFEEWLEKDKAINGIASQRIMEEIDDIEKWDRDNFDILKRDKWRKYPDNVEDFVAQGRSETIRRYKERYDDAIWGLQNALSSTYSSTIWRELCVDDAENFKNQVLNEEPNVGIYWAFDERFAITYLKDTGERYEPEDECTKVRLGISLLDDWNSPMIENYSMDFFETIVARMSQFHEELEITMFPNKKVKLHELCVLNEKFEFERDENKKRFIGELYNFEDCFHSKEQIDSKLQGQSNRMREKALRVPIENIWNDTKFIFT